MEREREREGEGEKQVDPRKRAHPNALQPTRGRDHSMRPHLGPGAASPHQRHCSSRCQRQVSNVSGHAGDVASHCDYGDPVVHPNTDG
eukprot:1809642-Amphidinium_carterae.1